ncbi:MAG: FAD-dependent oxidoreductase, partial [Clostridia bacterium]|nr:FAD-dependent oxidoreductase [Clostridia bacterium]
AESRFVDEQIAVCANSVDIHRESWGEYQTYSSNKNYYIPLSCLVSKNRRNLLAAGKCLSADTYAFSAVRVMPPCFAMGEAVGILSALSVKRDCSPWDVPTSDVQRKILENGGYLEL